MEINKYIHNKLFEQAYISVLISDRLQALYASNSLNEAVVADGKINQQTKVSKISFKGLTPKEHDAVMRQLKSSIPELTKKLTKEIFGTTMYAYNESSPKYVTFGDVKYTILLKYKSGVDSKTKFNFDGVSLIPTDSDSLVIYELPEGEKKTLVDTVNKSKRDAKTIQVSEDELSLKKKPLSVEEIPQEDPEKKPEHRVGKEKPSDKTKGKISVNDDGEYEINGKGLDTGDYDYEEAEFGKKKSKDNAEDIPVDTPNENPTDETNTESNFEPINFKKKTKASDKKVEKLTLAGIGQNEIVELAANFIKNETNFNYNGGAAWPVSSMNVEGVNFYVMIKFNDSYSVSGIIISDSKTHNDVVLTNEETNTIFKEIGQEKLKELKKGVMNPPKRKEDDEQPEEESSEIEEPTHNDVPDENGQLSMFDDQPEEDNGTQEVDEPTQEEEPVNNDDLEGQEDPVETQYTEEDPEEDSSFVSIDSEKYANMPLTPKKDLNVNIMKSLISKLKKLSESDFDKYREGEEVVKLVPKNEKGLSSNNGGKSRKIVPILIYKKTEEGSFELTQIGIKTVGEQKRQTPGNLLTQEDFNELKGSGMGVPTTLTNIDDAKIIGGDDFKEYDEKGEEITSVIEDTDIKKIFNVFGSRFLKDSFKNLKIKLISTDTYRVGKHKPVNVSKVPFLLSFDLKMGEDSLYLTSVSAFEKEGSTYVDVMENFTPEEKQEALDAFNEGSKEKFKEIPLEEFDKATAGKASKQRENNENKSKDEEQFDEPESPDEVPDETSKEDEIEVSDEAPDETSKEEEPEVSDEAPDETSKEEEEPEVSDENKFKNVNSQVVLNTVINFLNGLNVDKVKIKEYSGNIRTMRFKFRLLGVEGDIVFLIKKDENNHFHPEELKIHDSSIFFPNETEESLEKLIKNSLSKINVDKFNIEKFLLNPYQDESPDEDEASKEDEPEVSDEVPDENSSKKSFKDKVKDKYKELVSRYKNRTQNDYSGNDEENDGYEEASNEPNNNYSSNPDSFMGKSGRLVNKAFNTIGKAAYDAGKSIRQGARDFKAGYQDEKEKNKNKDHNKFYNKIKNNTGRNINRLSHAARNGLNEDTSLKISINEEINSVIIKKIDFTDVDFTKID